jgi:two-component system chemotaxis response regulator CheB
MNKIRVLIVEDSAVVRGLLEHIIGMDSRLEVAATAESGEEALRILVRMTPDVIAMDIQLPGIDGLETTRRIMSRTPIPIVVVTNGSPSREQSRGVAQALRAGALAVLEKPVGTTNAEYENISKRLCTQLVIMSEVKLVRQYANRVRREPPNESAVWLRNRKRYTMLGIACSTGGPPALVKLLGGLGPDFPLPILVVQHMGASFLEGFASWLDGVCPFPVVIANHGDIPSPHTVHIAPAERHLCVSHGRLYLDSADPVCCQRPSGTMLFATMAQSLGSNALGVLLTGMGKDGAAGLHDIRRAGGYTIAQDEATCAVYGMPGAAVEMGAVCETLPLDQIAPRLLELAAIQEAS